MILNFVVASVLAMPVVAQEAPDRAPTIQVIGTASVETPPDRARIGYVVNGEGKTADAASAALAARSKAIVDDVRALLGPDAEVTANDISISEVRGPECDRTGNYAIRLSEGPCAVIGHVATLQGQVKTAAVDKAATALGLAARLGARDARILAFELSDRGESLRRATAAAVADARVRAEALANGAGVRLGNLLALIDPNGSSEEPVAYGAHRRIEERPDVLPTSLAPAVPIMVTPRPIRTQARVTARYAITR